MNKQIILLGLAIFMIFFGFNGVQQYVTSFFDEKGILEIGFQSLILIYLFFVLANPLAAITAVKYGPKIVIASGSLSYSLYIFSLISGSVPFIYFTSILLGAGAAFLWMGENSYLLRISKDDSRGKNVGLLDMLLFSGSTVGIIGLGFLSSRMTFQLAFFPFAVMPLVGFFLLIKLTRLQINEKKNQLSLLLRAAKSITAIRIAGMWLIVSMVFGLVIGILPIQIKNTFGLTYVGILTSLPFIFPVFLSYGLGRISDLVGRKKIIVMAYVFILGGLFALQSSNIATLLVIGVILLALGWTTARIGLIPFTGDVSTKENLEALIAFFWMLQNIGVVFALLLGQFLATKIELLYIIAMLFTVLSLVVAFPLLRTSTADIRKRLSDEI